MTPALPSARSATRPSSNAVTAEELVRAINVAIRRVTDDIERDFGFNTRDRGADGTRERHLSLSRFCRAT